MNSTVDLAGNHYKIVFTAPSEQLRSEEKLFVFLRRAVKAIDCKIVAGPLVATIEESKKPDNAKIWEDDGGISGIVILSTSHIAAHFWTQERYGVIDAYSCKPYDIAALLEEILRQYEAERWRISDLSFSINGTVEWNWQKDGWKGATGIASE